MNRRSLLGLTAGLVVGTGCVSRSDRPADDRDAPITASTVSSVGSGARVAWARRYTAEGGRETVTPDTPDMDIRAVTTAPDGGFYLGGQRNDPDGSRDMLLFRTDGKGRKKWFEHYGGQHTDELTSLAPTADGGLLLVGTDGRRPGDEPARPTRRPERDVPRVSKVDATGSVQWQVAPTASDRDHLLDGVELADGRIAVVGRSHQRTDQAALLLVLASDGTVETTRRFHSESGGEVRTPPASGHPRYRDFFTSVCESNADGLVVAGENNRGGWVLGLDAEGRADWTLDLEFPRDVVGDVVPTGDGYIATGRLYGDSDQYYRGDVSDLYLLRIDNGGTARWLKAYGGERIEDGSAVVRTSDGGFLATGGSFARQTDDLFLTRTAPGGTPATTESISMSTDGGGSAEKPWEIPLYGYDVEAVAPDEYVVAAGYVFLKVVVETPTSTLTPTPTPTPTP